MRNAFSIKNCFVICFLLLNLSVDSQSVFTYTPLHPVAGDTIRITYTPAINTFYSPEGLVVKYNKNREYLFDLPIIKKGNSYSVVISTDTAMNLLVLSFKNTGVWDNNNNKGYFVYLQNSNAVKEFSYLNTAHVFDFYGPYKLGFKKSDSAAVVNYELEFANFPANRIRFFTSYLTDLKKIDQAKSEHLAKIEIERLLQKGLESRGDYDKVQDLYSLLEQPEKMEFYKKMRLEKIPYDKYIIEDLRKMLQQQKNVENKEQILAEFKAENRSLTHQKDLLKQIETVSYSLANDYLENKNWAALRNLVDSISSSEILNWRASQKAMLDSNTLIDARYFALKAVKSSKKNYESPGTLPNYLTYDELIKENRKTYAAYLDNYCSILILSKMYQEALPFAQEAALVMEEGNNVAYNSHYAIIASKSQPAEKYLPQLEKMVRDGKEDNIIVSILKDAYQLHQKAAMTFDSYLKKLKESAKNQLVNQLIKQKMNLLNLPFELKDTDGNMVRLSDYNGKTVILDFWATWCTPCVASFPAMNELVQQYKNDSTVSFLFINTLQNEEGKERVAKEFVNKNKYNFKVLVDADNKVAQLYEVSNIPVKMVIGKDGRLKFKSIGFKGADLLKKEIDAMIFEAN